MELYWEIISTEMRQVMGTFGSSPIGARFYLAGGTALALQLGHRRSFDLDFFSSTEDIPSLRNIFKETLLIYSPVLADTSWGNLVFLAAGVRVGFYGYGFPMVSSFTDAEGVNLASLEDIGLMKLDALLGRASRKDFLDLFFICQHIPLWNLFDLSVKKFPGTRDFEAQVAKRLVYFEHAELEEPPPLLQDIQWESVKTYFRKQVNALGKSWLV